LCVGANQKDCSPLEQCHAAGACNQFTGKCGDYPLMPDGTSCDDSNPLTNNDQCVAGICACTSSPEVCDSFDNDCDGTADNGLGTTTCGRGVCEHTIQNCVGGVVQICDPIAGSIPEVCDGLDNDCDGAVDEGVKILYYRDADGDSYGDANSRVEACEAPNGYVIDRTDCADNNAARFPGNPEVCDGLDNDCDVSIDEDLGQTACGLGVCEHSVDNCVGGVPQICDPMQGANKETCDGIDNDCDNAIDEDLTRGTICGKGACSGNAGFETCSAGVWGGDTCNPLAGATTEICDGAIDEDCDGTVDDGCSCTNGQTQRCGTTDVGVCEYGTETCTSGTWGTCIGEITATPETCDNKDNDCDGSTDEGLGQTSCGLGICAHTVENCLGGVPQTCDPMQGAVTETCNGLDDDCDASTDEGLGQTSCGLGICAHTVNNCVGGIPQVCNPMQGAVTEICSNGLDDDCDGSVDEDCVPIYTWSGFFQPVDNLPTENQVKAGSAVPVKFSLGGDMGLNIFATGYPLSQKIVCESGVPIDNIETTVNAGGSSLTYDPVTDRYNYVWKTEKSWVNCRQLVVKLTDGTMHYANFKFKK
jgi:hypothetical protein